MDIQAFGRLALPRRQIFTYVRWGAIVAGTVVAGASYLLLALLGVAVGLSTVAPGGGRLGSVSLLTGGWTSLAILVAVYIGAYVAGRVSGLSRRADGVVHGFVTWGAMTLLFVWLTTTELGPLLGGAFGMLGQHVVGLSPPGDGTLPAGLAAASWWLFAALALSLLGGLWGGMLGTRTTANRALGDHTGERQRTLP